jgi:hypothetical protein
MLVFIHHDNYIHWICQEHRQILHCKKAVDNGHGQHHDDNRPGVLADSAKLSNKPLSVSSLYTKNSTGMAYKIQTAAASVGVNAPDSWVMGSKQGRTPPTKA